MLGDGRRSVSELVKQVNEDPLRGTGFENLLVKLEIDNEARSCLATLELTPDSVPEAGQWVALRRIGNISTGGTAVDCTQERLGFMLICY